MGVSTALEERRCGGRRRRGGRSGWAPLDVEAAAPAAASVAVVMAPALTESAPQKPQNLLTPLPAGGFLSAQQAAQVCQKREVLAKFVVSASVEPSKIDDQCLRGISEELIRDVINSSKYRKGGITTTTTTRATRLGRGFGSSKFEEDDEESDAEEDEEGARLLALDEEDDGEEDDEEDVEYEELISARKKTEAEGSSPTEAGSNRASLKGAIPIMSCESRSGQRRTDQQQQQPQESREEITTRAMGFHEESANSSLGGCLRTAEPSRTILEEDNSRLLPEHQLPEVAQSVLNSLTAADLTSVGEEEDVDVDKDEHLDRLIGTFATDDLPPGVAPHMGHNVEDILQVIKSMEGVSASSEQPQGVEMFPISENFSSFERDLLNEVDVDVMSSLCTESIGIEATEVENQSRIDVNLKSMQENAELRQFETERRSAFLLRRLRKLQARLVGRHVAEETTGVLEMAHHSFKKYFFQELAAERPQKMTTSRPARHSDSVGGCESLGGFLARIEKSCAVQSNSVTNRQRVVCRYFGGGSRENATAAAVSTDRTSASRLPAAFSTGNRHLAKIDAEELESVAGSLAKQLNVVESNLDSDCTASSSGGESCDEMQSFNNPHQQSLPVSKRASWRYAQERAGVASRWTWLQTQISDLEYKIRQHNELQRQMRSSKGLVVLESNNAASGSSSSGIGSAEQTVNGYSGVLPGSTTGSRCGAQEPELPATRTRPFAWEIYRKRKLLQIDRLHEFSKRAARPSTVRCDCDQLLAACALCTGRNDPTQPQEPIELLSVPERVARIDPSFHPVLSFPDDIVAGTHLESIMRSVDWQQKMLRGNHRMTRIKDKETGSERRSKKQQQQQQQQQQPLQTEHRPAKYGSRIKKSSSSILTARIKRKMLKGKRERIGAGPSNASSVHSLSGNSRKRAAKIGPQQPEDEDETSLLSNSSKHSSPVPSPLQQQQQHANPTTTALPERNSVKEKSSNPHGRPRQNSYDIDNIVIPYSVAASTRLEKLQYKEILTPKWRLCEEASKLDVKNGVVHRPSQDSDVEDVSEEAIALRHERSEREENKRFMTYVNMPHQGRIRQNRRADSRADSGANTPDPMSPHASDFGGDVTSPITSPPATPSCVSQDGEQHQHQQHQNATALDTQRGSSLQNAIRRRTISTMRILKEDTASSFAEDDHEVAPYDARSFPLEEEVYDKMLEVMPDGHWQPSSSSLRSRDEDKQPQQQPQQQQQQQPADEEAEIESPESDSTESACCDLEGEDPNDPEWTVADDHRDTEKERIRPTAKR